MVTSCGAAPNRNWLTETPLACFSEIKVNLQNSSCPKTVFQVIHSDIKKHPKKGHEEFPRFHSLLVFVP